MTIPGLRTVDYRTHPIHDQIADKSAAMLATYAGRPSTRYRDLVDLVLIATTLTVDAEALHAAIVSEHQRRGIDPALALSLPSEEWHDGYRKIAAAVPNFQIHDADQAIDIAKRLLDPIRSGRVSGVWDPSGLEWRER